jgi:dCMP deaminase
MTQQRPTWDENWIPSWQEVWIEIALTIAKKSRCSRAQMGAVIVSSNQRIAATGYNGPAATFPNDDECINWCPRAQGTAPLDNFYDACPAIHAEANALLYVDRSHVEGGTIYITSPPCMQCAKLISNSGIAHVVCIIGKEDEHRNPDTAIYYLRKCGLRVTVIDRQTGEKTTYL